MPTARNFQADWNAHPLLGVAKDQSPNVWTYGSWPMLLFELITYYGFIGHAFLGDVKTWCLHRWLCWCTPWNQYYSVHGREIHWVEGQTGAGHPFNEEDISGENWADLGKRIAADQSANLHHEPVEVLEHTDPFTNDGHRQAFHTALSTVREWGLLPVGYGLYNEELDMDSYPAYEIIKSGRRAKELQVALPHFQWRPRAELWCQALDILNRIQFMYGDEHWIRLLIVICGVFFWNTIVLPS